MPRVRKKSGKTNIGQENQGKSQKVRKNTEFPIILFCKAIKFAVEDSLFLEKYVPKSAKKSGKFAQSGQEKMPKRAKSQEKVRKKCKQFRVATLSW